MKIDFFSTKPYDITHFDQLNQDHLINYHIAPLNEQTAEIVNDADAVCVFVNDDVNEACLKKLADKKVRIIALRCAGFNNIDLKACKKLGLKVVVVPQYSPHAVAEHATGLLLALNRKIHKAYNRIREGNFSLEGLEGFDLYKKTIGIIGLGNIGNVFADICNGFGCKVLRMNTLSFIWLMHASLMI